MTRRNTRIFTEGGIINRIDVIQVHASASIRNDNKRATSEEATSRRLQDVVHAYINVIRSVILPNCTSIEHRSP